jgi:hypothetical protein
MASVGEIVIDVTADVGPLVKQMGKGEKAMGGLQGAAGRMGSGLSRAGDMAATFGKRLAIVSAGIAALTGATLAFVRNAASVGDAIGDASKAAGMSTTAFQEYRFALMEAAAMSDEEFASATERLNKTLGEARSGSEAAIKAFEAIGVSQADLASGTFGTDQAMAAFVKTVEGIKDPAIAAAVSTDLFGRAGASLGASLAGTPGQVGSLVDRARELGVVLDGDAIEAAGAFDQKMNELMTSLKSMATEVGISLMPALNKIIDAIQKYVIPALGMDGLGGAVKGAIDLVILFAEETGKAFTSFKAAVGGAVDWVIDKFDTFMAKLDEIIGKAKAVGQAVADALKFDAGSATNTFQEDYGMGGAPANNSVGGGAAGGAAGGQMLGAAIVNGAFLGTLQAMEEKKEAFAAIFAQIPQIARETLGINSPSKVFEDIGGYLGEGLANGITGAQAMVGQAVSAMGASAVTASDGMVSDILGGMDTLLAGSQKGGAALAWINTLIGASQELKKGTFGFATMAAVIAKGAALVSAIKGGGESRSRGGGASSAASPAAAPQQTTQNLGITFVSDPFGIGERVARDLAARVNAAQRNGIRLNVGVAG